MTANGRTRGAIDLARPDLARPRCPWAGKDPLYLAYHDEEWGVPLHDDRALFELLILEGAQAGLSWLTVLKKRENYRKAFHNFDVQRIAGYSDAQIAELLKNPGIIRNRLKVNATVKNAQALILLRKEFASFDQYLWHFVGGGTMRNHWTLHAKVPARSTESDALSKDLLKRGFTFVGSTICYAFMQASGMVNDHVTTCFRRGELA
jgi:DNA-3-methyladenine glycosylase I